MKHNYFALMLDTRGRRCLVVGGGEVAHRKVRDALEAGLAVVVVSPRAVPALRELAARGQIWWEEREFQEEDVHGVSLVFAAATPGVNARVCRAARRAGVLVNVVDRPGMSDFICPAVLRRGPLTVAVSTAGASPALAARIRDRLAGLLGEEAGQWAALLASFRREVRERVPDPSVRQGLLRRAAQLDGENMIARGERRALEELLESWLTAATGEAGGGNG